LVANLSNDPQILAALPRDAFEDAELLELLRFPLITGCAGPARIYTPRVQTGRILLDIGLAGMDGYEVCRVFRKDEKFRTIPIIAQTGWGQASGQGVSGCGGLRLSKASAAAAAFDYHLVKPIRFDELAKVLQETEAAADILGTAI
jgi:CheY-like chemotaxis protein